MSFTPQDLSSSVAGWTCPNCNKFVPAGDYHVCQRTEWFTPISRSDNTVNEETNKLLERIAVALEKIAEKI